MPDSAAGEQPQNGHPRPDYVPPAHKWCRDCGNVKPHEQFPRNKARSDGYHTYCKLCANARDRASKASGERMAAGPLRTNRESQAKRNELLLAITEGLTVRDACARVGVSMDSYRYYRQVDDDFRRRIDQARVTRNREQGDVRWTGNFASFRETFFPLKYPTPAFHIEIINKMESVPALAIGMVLCPPNAGKSTLMEDWIAYKLATDPNQCITVVSKSQGQARKMLVRVQRRMTDAQMYPDFIARFGPFYVEGQEREGKPWTKDFFTVNRADHDERDYSLQCLGWNGQVYGSRVDTLICDDIQTIDNLSSIEHMLDKFNLEYMSRLDEDCGRLFIVGTRIEMGDIYERLIDADIISHKHMTVLAAVNAAGESYWPERWPIEKLDHDADDPSERGMRQKVREKAWWTGYMQQPSVSNSATFTDDMVDRACNRSLKVGPALDACPVVLGLDPALGGGNALIAIAYGIDHMTVLDCQRDVGLAQSEQILHLIEQFAIRYHPRALIVETVAFQRALARDERLSLLAAKYGFTIHEHNTGRNKLDPVLGVASMDTSFIRGEISIPWADDIAELRMAELVAELRAWRPNVPTRLITQDLVMALWFCWLYILQQRRVMGAPADAWKRDALPWRPTEVTTTGLVLPSQWKRAA